MIQILCLRTSPNACMTIMIHMAITHPCRHRKRQPLQDLQRPVAKTRLPIHSGCKGRDAGDCFGCFIQLNPHVPSRIPDPPLHQYPTAQSPFRSRIPDPPPTYTRQLNPHVPQESLTPAPSPTYTRRPSPHVAPRIPDPPSPIPDSSIPMFPQESLNPPHLYPTAQSPCSL